MKSDEKLDAMMTFLREIAVEESLPNSYRDRAIALITELADPKTNPFAPPIELAINGEAIIGRANFGHLYEGGTVHGGFVAATFDQLLYTAQTLTKISAMTAKLTIHYRKPTPILTELKLDAAVDRIEGRKIFTKGTVSAKGTVTAEGEGVFIAVAETDIKILE